MTETSRQIPSGVYSNSDSGYDMRKEIRGNEESRAEICKGLLREYSDALRKRDDFYSQGEGKLHIQRISPIAEAKKPKLGTGVTMESIEKKMGELQNTLDTIIGQLLPYGFRFNHGGFLEKANCEGFAKDFFDKRHFAKFREGVDSILTKPTIVANDYSVNEGFTNTIAEE